MLATALEDRGDVLAQHEFLHGNYVKILGRSKHLARCLYKKFWKHPRHIWDRSIFDFSYQLKRDPRELTGAGFIMHRCMSDLIPGHPHLHSPGFGEGAWKLIEADKDLKIIFVHRENQLKRRVSELAAKGTGNWQSYRRPQPSRSVKISPDGFIKHVKWYFEFYDAAKHVLRQHDMIDVVYEEVVSDPFPQMRRIQEFLGLDPIDIGPRTFKRGRKLLHKAIVNYDEVCQALEGTEYARYLVDEPDAEFPAHVKPMSKR